MICRGKDSCGRDLPATEFNRNGRGGRMARCRECGRKAAAARRAAGLDRGRTYREKRATDVRSLYGIGLAAADAILRYQRGRCGICREPFYEPPTSTGRFAAPTLDHDHETDEVRGLLHVSCNSLLGAVGDDLDGARRAGNSLLAAYLLDPPAPHALAAGPAYQHRPIRSIEPLALPV